MLPTLILAWAAVMQDVEELRKAGEKLLQADDCKGALLKFEKAIAAAPNQADLHLGRGRALMGLRLFEDSEAGFNQALELDPSLALAYYFRGQLRSYREAHQEALADYDRCVERGIRDPQVFGLKAFSLNKLARHAEAEALYSRELSEGIPSAMAYSGRARARMILGNLRGAISDETRSIELDPADPHDYRRRGFAYLGEESWENALRDLRKAAELEKTVGDVTAHWIFLCRCRMGQKEEAVQELREFIKTTSGRRDASSWEQHLFSFDLGDLSDTKVLEQAKENPQRAAAHVAIATMLLTNGKSEEALDHLQHAAKFHGEEGQWSGIVARAELQRQWRRKVDALLEELQAKVKALPPFEATYVLEMPWPAEVDHPIHSFVWTVDMGRKESFLVARGKSLPRREDFTMSMHVKDLQLYVWGEALDGYHRMDFAFMPKTIEDMEAEVERILPNAFGGESPKSDFPSIGLGLERKPGKDQEGTIQFTLGVATTPCSWLKEPPGPDDILRVGREDVVFEFPSRKKTVTIDRRTGLLKLIETVDFDGTRRSIRQSSYKPLESWPKINHPEKESPLPFDLARFKQQMFQEEGVLHNIIAVLMRGWDEVVRKGSEDQVRAIVTRWAARYADGIHAYAVRSLAGNRIQQELDRGTPASTLLKNADAEVREFAVFVTQERKSIDDLLKSQLSEFAERVENGLFERSIDSRLHGAARALVKKAVDIQTVERERKALFGDRIEQLYREELRTRARL